MDDQNFLHQVFSLKDFSREQQDEILARFKRTEFEKGAYLLEQGKTAHRYWFLESGFIRSFALDTDGNDVTTNLYAAGDIIIDWPSFFMRVPTREYIQALSACVCWELDFETFQRLFHSMEPFRESGRARLVKSYFELKRHSISLITDQARDRYLRLLEEKPEILQNVSLKQIASYLGITDTSLSRIRKEIAAGKP